MKINKMFISFTGVVKPGLYAYFIDMSRHGFDMDNDKLIETVMHFPNIVFIGDEPLQQKEELSKFIKKYYKDNPKGNLIIHTNGTIKPTEMGKYPIIFNVYLSLKYTNIPQETRIKPEVINAFRGLDNTNFIFDVRNEDDIDEAMLLMNTFGLKKSKVFMSFIDQDKFYELLKYAKYRGVNIAPDFRKYFWHDDEVK